MVSWRKPSTSAACSRTLLLSWEIIVFCPARARLSVDNFTGHWCPPSLSHSGELPFHYQRYLASSNTHREHTHFKDFHQQTARKHFDHKHCDVFKHIDAFSGVVSVAYSLGLNISSSLYVDHHFTFQAHTHSVLTLVPQCSTPA